MRELLLCHHPFVSAMLTSLRSGESEGCELGRSVQARAATGRRTLERVRRTIGSWLSGPSAVARDEDRPRWRGERFGLPEGGVGAAAPTGRRVLGFVVDIVLATPIAFLFTAPSLPFDW